MNEITETLWYNLRIIIDTDLYNNDSEPRSWLVSKVNRIAPRGICNLTMTQDRWDQRHDYIERDEEGNIVGIWADYFQSNIKPESINVETTSLLSSITSKITYSGTSNQVKLGGSKTFTVTFLEEDTPVEHDYGTWSVLMDGDIDVTDQLSPSYPAENKLRIKIPRDNDLIGKILSIVHTSEDIVSSTDVEIKAL